MPPPQDVDRPFTPPGHGMDGRTQGVARQLARFTGIGVVMTLAYLALYAFLQGTLGGQGANVVAWVATAVVDTAANRRLTFGLSGRAGAARAQGEGLVVFGIGMVLTSGSLFTLDALVPQPNQILQLGVLLLANIAAGLLRFALLRHWVFAPRRHRGPDHGLAPALPGHDLDRAATRPVALTGGR
jgi:putative flippase GtrA